MNEDLEIARAEHTKRVLSQLTKIVEGKDTQIDDKLKAVALESQIFRDLISSDITHLAINTDERTKDKLIKQAEKLNKDQSEP